MKRSSPFLVSALFLFLVCPVRAQTTTASDDTSKQDLRPIPEAPLAPEDAVEYSLDLKWNESRVDATVTYENSSDQPLKISGIQCSGGLFIVDYPQNIPAKGAGKINLIFQAKIGTQSDMEIIRLKTDAGDKLIRIAHDRPTVASFDQPTLVWQIGDTPAAKSVVLTLANGVKAAKVQAMRGNSATIEDLGGGRFRIAVMPKSTAKPTTFPVIVTLDPEVPGVTPIITCTIGSND
jgi:hypothetical protein